MHFLATTILKQKQLFSDMENESLKYRKIYENGIRKKVSFIY